jgi:ribosomal protein L23
MIPKNIYFPNIIFKCVRSNLPPNQVAFRVPTNLNKIDIQNYLTNIYNVGVKDVRTMIYESETIRNPNGPGRWKRGKYKKAIVTLEEEFNFPPINPDLLKPKSK